MKTLDRIEMRRTSNNDYLEHHRVLSITIAYIFLSNHSTDRNSST